MDLDKTALLVALPCDMPSEDKDFLGRLARAEERDRAKKPAAAKPANRFRNPQQPEASAEAAATDSDPAKSNNASRPQQQNKQQKKQPTQQKPLPPVSKGKPTAKPAQLIAKAQAKGSSPQPAPDDLDDLRERMASGHMLTADELARLEAAAAAEDQPSGGKAVDAKKRPAAATKAKPDPKGSATENPKAAAKADPKPSTSSSKAASGSTTGSLRSRAAAGRQPAAGPPRAAAAMGAIPGWQDFRGALDSTSLADLRERMASGHMLTGACAPDSIRAVHPCHSAGFATLSIRPFLIGPHLFPPLCRVTCCALPCVCAQTAADELAQLEASVDSAPLGEPAADEEDGPLDAGAPQEAAATMSTPVQVAAPDDLDDLRERMASGHMLTADELARLEAAAAAEDQPSGGKAVDAKKRPAAATKAKPDPKGSATENPKAAAKADARADPRAAPPDPKRRQVPAGKKASAAAAPPAALAASTAAISSVPPSSGTGAATDQLPQGLPGSPSLDDIALAESIFLAEMASSFGGETLSRVTSLIKEARRVAAAATG